MGSLTRSSPALLFQMQFDTLFPPDVILSPEGEYVRLYTLPCPVSMKPTSTSPLSTPRIRIIPSLDLLGDESDRTLRLWPKCLPSPFRSCSTAECSSHMQSFPSVKAPMPVCFHPLLSMAPRQEVPCCSPTHSVDIVMQEDEAQNMVLMPN
jgi:hypothetical protein